MPENARNTDQTEPEAATEVTDTTAAEPEAPAAEAAAEEPASEPGAAEAAGDQTPADEPASEPVAEEAAGEQPPAEQPPADEPVSEPATVEATADQPPAEQPASEPEAEEPADAAATDAAAAEEPSAEEPAAAAATDEAAPADVTAPAPEAPPAAGEPAAAEAPPAAADAPATAEAAEPAEPPEPVEEPEEIKALRAAKESGQKLEGKVIGWNRGGFHVALEGGITAFCPNSEMELGRPRSPETYVDRVLGFAVIKVQRRGRRVVLSREAVLKEDRERLLAELRERAGAVLKGTVTSITDFGAFVDLGGLEGLVHVSELSRRRVGHPKNAVSIGQEVEVKVLKIEQDGERISLSMKALEPDPWGGVAERYPAGSQFTGKIARKTDFGLFVELEPEIDGLVHVSRLPHGADIDDPSLAVGETVTGWVQEVEVKRQRVSLSLREMAKGDPWRGIDASISEGAVIEGTVESAMPFGVFISLQPGLTGLLPTAEMGIPKGTNPARLYSPGQKVTVQVASIDKRRKRISLARQGSKVEGSRADYQAYRKRQQEDAAKGLSALAHALAKLRDEGEDGGEGAPE
jgi:small subunit ribosomal protein S1